MMMPVKNGSIYKWISGVLFMALMSICGVMLARSAKTNDRQDESIRTMEGDLREIKTQIGFIVDWVKEEKRK